MNAKSLGTILRDWRVECDLTQSELGEAAGLSRRIVGNIERGDRKVDYEEVIKLCRALGRHVEELVLHWSRSALEGLRKVETEMLGSREARRSDKPDSETLDATASGFISEGIDKMAELFKEIIHRSQEELIQKLLLHMNLSGASSPPPPAAPKRSRSRVSRRGRVAGRSST